MATNTDPWKNDNIIKWIFDKIFNQLTDKGAEIYITPFDRIKEKTFQNIIIYQIIRQLTYYDIDRIKFHLLNEKFQEKILFEKMKKKINVQILLNNIDSMKNLMENGYQIDDKSIQLCVLNNRMDMLKLLLKEYQPKLRHELLIYCVENGYEEMYLFLKKHGLVPNISILHKSMYGNSLVIVKDITQYIAISRKILETAFQTNNTEIILYLLEDAIYEKIKIDNNWITYPILNNNLKLLMELEYKSLVDWHVELYYSAILSGSMAMIKYIELKLPDIHHGLILDTTKTKKGYNNLLLDDMIYYHEGKKYFSKCINYAVQSGEMEIVEYIYSKGYGISSANFLTAMKQGNLLIIDFLAKHYNKELPFYYINYFGPHSFFADKLNKAKILIEHGLLKLNIDTCKLSCDDYRKETTHIEMIKQNLQLLQDTIDDIDYLMNYQLFFVTDPGNKLNYRLISTLKICLQLDLQEELKILIGKGIRNSDKQIAIDCLFLYGNIQQIKIFHPLISLIELMVPSIPIVMELVCYCQINKLCYLYSCNLLSKQIIDTLYPLSIMLSNPYLDSLFSKVNKQSQNMELKFVLLSGDKDALNRWINSNPQFNTYDISKDIFKTLLLLEDVELIKKFHIPKKFIEELIEWCDQSDLLEIKRYLMG